MLNTIQLEMVAQLDHEARLRAAAKTHRLQPTPRQSRLWRWRTWWPAGKAKEHLPQPAKAFNRVESTPHHQPL